MVGRVVSVKDRIRHVGCFDWWQSGKEEEGIVQVFEDSTRLVVDGG